MKLLVGEYFHQIDSKNRIRIPNKLKGEEKTLWFSKGTNRCLFVHTEKEYEVFYETLLKNISVTENEETRAERMILKSTVPLDGDTQGRMILPQNLKDYAKIDKDVMICGMGTRVEIWAKEVYDEYFKDENEHFDEVIHMLGK